MDQKELKRSSADWQFLYPEVEVYDPDGWDRKNFQASWLEPITLREYETRIGVSTCHYRGVRGETFLKNGVFNATE